jgi:hypothetical protein
MVGYAPQGGAAWAIHSASAVSRRPGTDNPVDGADGPAICRALYMRGPLQGGVALMAPDPEAVRAAQPQPEEGAAGWSGLSAMMACYFSIQPKRSTALLEGTSLCHLHQGPGGGPGHGGAVLRRCRVLNTSADRYLYPCGSARSGLGEPLPPRPRRPDGGHARVRTKPGRTVLRSRHAISTPSWSATSAGS